MVVSNPGRGTIATVMLGAKSRPFSRLWVQNVRGKVIKPANPAAQHAVGTVAPILRENTGPALGESKRQTLSHNAEGVGRIDQHLRVVVE